MTDNHQEGSAPTIHQLAAELVTQIELLPSIKKRGFYVFDMDDAEQKADIGGYPICVVAYEGIGEMVPLNSGRGRPQGNNSVPGAILAQMVFSVVVGVEYHAAGQDDTKSYATDLLDETRGWLLGFHGVNPRPWVILGENPVPGNSEGVIWYGQQWATDVAMLGRR